MRKLFKYTLAILFIPPTMFVYGIDQLFNAGIFFTTRKLMDRFDGTIYSKDTF